MGRKTIKLDESWSINISPSFKVELDLEYVLVKHILCKQKEYDVFRFEDRDHKCEECGTVFPDKYMALFRLSSLDISLDIGSFNER